MYLRLRVWLFIFFFCTLGIKAQEAFVSMNVITDHENGSFVNSTIEIKNSGSSSFDGLINITPTSGFKSFSGNQISVHVPAKSSKYISAKFIYQKRSTSDGESIRFILKNDKGELLDQKEYFQEVQKINAFKLNIEESSVFISDIQDSIRIKASVVNLGNRENQVYVVFSIPELTNQNNFFEQKSIVSPQTNQNFTFKFLPNKQLLQLQKFTVRITAMYGESKEMIGNGTVVVESINSSQKYINTGSSVTGEDSSKGVTTSYRIQGKNSSIYRIYGNGNINLRTGYLSGKMNMYQNISSKTAPIITNTELRYHLKNTTTSFGNMSKSFDIPVYGRGVSFIYKAAKRYTAEIGIVDANYNLLGEENLFSNGYALYLSQQFGNTLQKNKSLGFNYVLKNDNQEKVVHNFGNIYYKSNISSKIYMEAQLYSAYSDYDTYHQQKFSGAAKLLYRANFKEYNINGTYGWGSRFYPGSQRGLLQLQQSVSKKLGSNTSVYASVYSNTFRPQYFGSEAVDTEISNFNINSGINFSLWKSTSMRFSYNYTREANNTYSLSGASAQEMELHYNQISTNLSWSIPKLKTALTLQYDGRWSILPFKAKAQYYMKWAAGLSHSHFNVSYSYQEGPSYLYEYIYSLNNGFEGAYTKTIFSATYQQYFFKKQLYAQMGVNYISNKINGKTPSEYVNLKYSIKDLDIFFKASYYKNTSFLNAADGEPYITDMQSMEFGLTYHFKSTIPDPGIKSNITGLVFYDLNSNGIRDKGEEIVSDYLVTINHNTFKTDNNGIIRFRSVPYGDYTLKARGQKGWFNEERLFTVKERNYSLNIPLVENGTISGKIQYQFDKNLSYDVTPLYGGIQINAYANGKLVQTTITDNDGNYTLFLPKGTYTIELNENMLPAKTLLQKNNITEKVLPGAITKVEPFIIKVENKKINIKKFTS